MWPSKRKPCIMCWKKFWVKATITNYNLWTIAPANLKSLARVVMEIWTKMYPDRPYSSFAKNCNEHCYVRCTRKSVYSPLMVNTWPRPQSQWASWLPKCSNESSSQHFDGKEQEDKRVERSLVQKFEERSDWRVFSVQLLCLPTCNYGNGSVSQTANVSYTADFFEP